MRKILSFLALLVVGFAIPWHAGAWNYSQGSDPAKIVINAWMLNDGEKSLELEFANGIWSKEFTANDTYTNFTVQVYYETTTTTPENYYDNVTVSSNETWSSSINNPKTGGSFKFENLIKDQKYRFELTAADDDNNKFKFRYVKIGNTQSEKEYTIYLNNNTTNYSEPYCYIYKNGGAGKDTWAGVKMSAEANGIYSYNFKTTGDYDCVIFSDTSKGSNQTAGDGAVSLVNNKVYYLTDKATNNNGEYKNVSYKDYDPNDYVPVVDTYPTTLYMYNWDSTATGPTPSQKTSVNGNNGVYVFNSVNLDAGYAIVFSTESNQNSWDGIKDKRYSPSSGSDVNMPVSDNGVSKSNDGSWVAKNGGTYNITIDLANNKLTATGGNPDPVTVDWDFNGNTKPSEILIHFNDDITAGDYTMTYDGTIADYKWSYEYTSNGGDNSNYCHFAFKCKNGDNWETFYGAYGSATIGNWTELTARHKNDGEAFYQGGLQKGHKYRVELKGNDNQSFSFRFVDITSSTPEKTVTIYLDNNSTNFASPYCYAYNANGTKYKEWAGEAMTKVSDRIYSYTLPAGYDYVIFSDEKANQTGDNVSIVDGHVYSKDGTHKVYNASDYAISLGDIYLFKQLNGNNWSNLGVLNSGNSYTIKDIKVTAATIFTFSTNSTNGNNIGWESLKGNGNTMYSDGTWRTVSPGTSYTFKEAEGNFKIDLSNAGTYTVTIDTASGTVKFTKQSEGSVVSNVNLPLKRADFNNNKKHYFLVGQRMGQWKLQPEWEFTEVNGHLELDNRFIYNGKLAVAVVDNYTDYTNHKYTYYTNSDWWIQETNNAHQNIELNTSGTITNEKGKSQDNVGGLEAHLDNSLTDNSDPYWHGRGRFVNKITVNLSNGNPSTMTFEPGTAEDAGKNRMFTLVGDNIFNRNFSNTAGPGKTFRYNLCSAGNGWSEGWIQFDPETNRPYVDGLGEYLYHTSYTPDYMLTHPVHFNQTIQGENGEENFPYTSLAIQFVDYRMLSHLDDDPYAKFYESFSGKEQITDVNSRKTLTGHYDYVPKVDTNTANRTTTPSENWTCLVVRDMWVGGQFKFWSGWGGNVNRNGGSDNDGATWHAPNGGPDISQNGRHQIHGYDVTEGGDAYLYKNVRNRDNTNYKTGVQDNDQTPIYFNRVVLWYNEEGGVPQSYIQFIQESAGPAILAQTVANDNDRNLENYIRYGWYLNQSTGENDADRQVVGYQIRRYIMEDGDWNFIGYPEGEYVDVSDKNVTVSDLYRNSATRPDWTRHTDTGIVPGRGFAPGLYRYEITVTYETEDGVSKYAVSNEVAIYNDDLVTPEALAYQIVVLDDKSAAKTALGLAAEKGYMTYNPTSGSTLYAFNITTNGGVEIPTDVERIANRTTAINYLRDNQDKTTWTSDYYVRCLDLDDYTESLEGYQSNGLITDETIPTPTVTVQAIEKGVENPIELGNAAPFNYNGKHFYSLIARRNGDLRNAEIEVSLSYTYHDADKEEHKVTTTNACETDPVMPRPYGAELSYAYSHDKTAAHGLEGQYAKINVPVNNAENVHGVKDTQDVYLLLDDFHTRNLTLQVTFQRPNVAQNIYEKYDIDYNVALTNTLSSDVPLNATAQLKDAEYVEDNYGKGYRFNFSGLHPENGVTPNVRFANTVFTSRTDATRKDATGTFGNGINTSKEHEFKTERGEGFENGKLYLGKIQRNGGWDWAYKGHTSFDDQNDNIAGADMVPNYYLFEIYNDNNDSNVYEYLVPHHSECKGNDAHLSTDAWYVDNDNDPLTLTYIAKGFSTDANPTVKVTAIYVFERPVMPQAVDHDDYNTVQVNKMVFVNNDNHEHDSAAIAAAKATAKAAANGKNKVSASESLIAGNAGSMPDTGTHRDASGKSAYGAPGDNITYNMNALHDATGYNQYVAIKGETYTYTTDDLVVTGVEEILNGYENDGEAVFYNLQGIQIDTPTTPGVYIRVQGKNATKVVIK